MALYVIDQAHSVAGTRRGINALVYSMPSARCSTLRAARFFRGVAAPPPMFVFVFLVDLNIQDRPRQAARPVLTARIVMDAFGDDTVDPFGKSSGSADLKGFSIRRVRPRPCSDLTPCSR